MDIDELKSKLNIEVTFKKGGRAYWDGDHTLTVKLKYGDEVISESQTSIPNNDRESPY